MKKVLLSIVLLCTVFSAKAQNLAPTVDKRIELMALVFRLAGAEEYQPSYNYKSSYTDKIERKFAPFRGSEVVKYTQQLRNKYGIGFDAVILFALYTEITDGKVAFRNDVDIRNLDKRWPQDSLPKYMNLLNKFYKQTGFDAFFASNADLYAKAGEAFKTKVMNEINLKWFDDFFGQKKADNFKVMISLSFCEGNYGPHIKDKSGNEEYYTIYGSCRTDSAGIPIYGQMGWLVAHELSHSYWNPAIKPYYPEVMPQATKMFYLAANYLQNIHYGDPKSCFGELLANASAILYDVDNPSKYAFNYDEHIQICQNSDDGFIAIGAIVEALKEYRKQRDKYPNITDYMPEIVKAFNSVDAERVFAETENQRPLILGTNIENGSQDVDPALDSIVVYFDRRMNVHANGWSPDSKCKTCKMPNTEGLDSYWNKDAKSWVVKVELEPDTEYTIIYPSFFFYAENNCHRPKNNYRLTFKTRKKQ